MLKQIKYIQNVGKFAKAEPEESSPYNRCVLFFGENGWGKSTISDILRSVSTADPDILIGRKTLGVDNGSDQKVVMDFGDEKAVFAGGVWNGVRPKIEIYDSVFVHNNIHSGDTVSSDQLQNQHGLVIGETGVQLVQKHNKLNENGKRVLKCQKYFETKLLKVVKDAGRLGLSVENVINLEAVQNVDEEIQKKEIEINTLRKSQELKFASVPASFPEPSERSKFELQLQESITVTAGEAIRRHIDNFSKHTTTDSPHEAWIEAGLPFVVTDDCPFCGQELRDRQLVDAYGKYFSDAYKTLSASIQISRASFARYSSGEFQKVVLKQWEDNQKAIKYWKIAGSIDEPVIEDIKALVGRLVNVAASLDELFAQKQANPTEMLDGTAQDAALTEWEQARGKLVQGNAEIKTFVEKIDAFKASIDPAALTRVEGELSSLRAKRDRHSADAQSIVDKIRTARSCKQQIDKEKIELRQKITTHTKETADRFNGAINAYLERLNAGFRIRYTDPGYRGNSPIANYQILINDVPVTPQAKGDDRTRPSFRNTLSGGDKSVLALAFFLAKVNADSDLAKSIIVFDDPFASQDDFRRVFTANQIYRLCDKSLQVILLSHDKNFLHLLWDKIDPKRATSLSIRAAASDTITIVPYNIVDGTRPRDENYRMKIEEFINGEPHDGEPHDKDEIRKCLRIVCETFYRQSYSGVLASNATLGDIINFIQNAPEDNPHKEVLDGLRDVNEYSRPEHHGSNPDGPVIETSYNELMGYCRRVRDLTRGI